MADLPDSATANDPFNEVPTPRTVDRDVPCVRCGYNLRGLTPDTRCPECGTAVNQSLQGNFLRFADPDWLGRLQTGTSLKLWNVLFGLLLGAGSYFAQSMQGSRAIPMLLSLVSGMLALAAAFLITSPEPAVHHEDGMSLRQLVRICAITAFCGGIIMQAGKLGMGGFIAVGVGGLLQLTGVVQLFGEFVYYRRFARRIPDAKLERSTSTVMWGMVSSYAAMVVCGVVAVAAGGLAVAKARGGAPSIGATGGLVVVGFTTCFAVVGVIVFSIWNFVLLAKYRKAFQLAAAGQSLVRE